MEASNDRGGVRTTGRADVGNQVTEALGTEGFKTFGHERSLHPLAGSNIPDLHVNDEAGWLLKLQHRGILAGDQCRIQRAVLQLDIPGAMLVIHHATRINDVHEKFCYWMGTDTGKIRTEVVTDIT